MTTEESRRFIYKNKEKFAAEFINYELKIKQPKEVTISGIVLIHQFLTEQINGWLKLEEKYELPYPFKKSLDICRKAKKQIEKDVEIFQFYPHIPARDFIVDTFSLYNNHYISFLLKLYQQDETLFQSAFNFFNQKSLNLNNSESLKGAILAYEFEKAQEEQIDLKSYSKGVLDETKINFQKYTNEAEAHLNKHLNQLSSSKEECVKNFEQMHSEKEKLFNEWHSQKTDNVETITHNYKKRIEELEDTYNTLLSLKKPGEYWQTRGEKLNKQGWYTLRWLVGLVAFTVLLLFALLWLTPEDIFIEFKNNPSLAVRWSIIFITLISFLAFAIRSVSKVMFSSFHLARDCEERNTLTYFYLALMNDANVENEQKQLIMQSLFSRADTGLLKDDSGPTMPSNIVGKLFN